MTEADVLDQIAELRADIENRIYQSARTMAPEPHPPKWDLFGIRTARRRAAWLESERLRLLNLMYEIAAFLQKQGAPILTDRESLRPSPEWEALQLHSVVFLLWALYADGRYRDSPSVLRILLEVFRHPYFSESPQRKKRTSYDYVISIESYVRQTTIPALQRAGRLPPV